MHGDTEGLEMLIVLYICLSIMWYDSRDMNFGERETIVLYSQSR